MSEERQADEVGLREPQAPQIDDAKSAPEDRAEAGPFDASEVPAMRPYVDLGGIKVAPREGTLRERLEAVERVLVAETLRAQGGNKTKAAKVLGLTREGLHKKLRLLGMA